MIKECKIKQHLEECQFCGDRITKNKSVELCVDVGDTVYFIDFPTNASIHSKEKPSIKSGEVYKVEYSNKRGYERFRVDYQYINKLGDYSTDWQMWKDGFLYASRDEADKKLQGILENY